MRMIEILSEATYYNGTLPATPTRNAIEDVLILKNPSSREMKNMLDKTVAQPHSWGVELRGILGDTDLYMWDAGKASHHDMTKEFGFTGMHMYFFNGYFKMDDYNLRHPDMQKDAMDFVMNHPMIKRIYGEVTTDDTEDYGFIYISK